MICLEDTRYIKRHCDDELYNLLSDGRYCHILESNGSGKSSLLVRTAERLRETGREVIFISCLGIDSQYWANELIHELFQDSFLADTITENEVINFLEKNNYGALIKMSDFIEKYLLSHNPIILIDDLEYLDKETRELLVTWVRSMWESSRSSEGENHVTFCLSGDVSFSGYRTPYNIGNKISLTPSIE
jgi:hypothetical protein